MTDWYDKTVALCDAALARQAAILARLTPNTVAYALAEDTLIALQHTKTIVVLGQKRQAALLVRRLRLEVLLQYRLRGQIVARAACRVKHRILLDELDALGDDLDETWQCLKLYRDWKDFCKAERWYQAIGKPTPDNLDDALNILSLWQMRRHSLH